MGLIFGQPKGREEQFGSYSRKGAKGAVLCLFSLTAWPVSPGQLGLAFSINRESLAQKMARNSLGKALPNS